MNALMIISGLLIILRLYLEAANKEHPVNRFLFVFFGIATILTVLTLIVLIAATI